MLAEFIRALEKKYNLINIAFEKTFRKKALLELSDSEFGGIVFISLDEYETILQYKNEFSNIFFEEDSYLLLWVCRCLYFKNNQSMLSLMNKYISNVCNITRGNLNTYKLNGWDVHILYVYQLANYNFANGIIPHAYIWKFDVKYIFDYFQNLYNDLSPNGKYILKIGSFLHDIGVITGVKDHEVNGIPLTEKCYKELGIAELQYKKSGVTLNDEEIIIAIKAMVGNHQIINQISAEVSDKYIFEKIFNIKNEFSFSKNLNEIYINDFVKIMSILAISDMMAVDDSLLSKEKFCELKDSISFLNDVIKHSIYKRDTTKYGIKRLVSLLKDDLKKDADNVIYNILCEQYSNKDDIIDFLYNVKFMSYAMAAIKPLENIEKSLRLIDVCMKIYIKSDIPIQNLTIKFDPNIDNNKLGVILNHPSNYIITNKLLEYSIKNEEYTIEIKCQ